MASQKSGWRGKNKITIKNALTHCRRTQHRPVRIENWHRFEVLGAHILVVIFSSPPFSPMDYPGATREYRWQIFEGQRPSSGGIIDC